MIEARAGMADSLDAPDPGSAPAASPLPETGPAPETGLALVLTGGGARAAFQTGFLAALGEHRPDLEIDILTGVSAGAINAAYLASHEGSFGERTAALEALWRDLTPERVYDVRPFALSRKVGGWGFRLLSGGLGPRSARPRGLLDTTPIERHRLGDRRLDAFDQFVLTVALETCQCMAAFCREFRATCFDVAERSGPVDLRLTRA